MASRKSQVRRVVKCEPPGPGSAPPPALGSLLSPEVTLALGPRGGPGAQEWAGRGGGRAARAQPGQQLEELLVRVGRGWEAGTARRAGEDAPESSALRSSRGRPRGRWVSGTLGRPADPARTCPHSLPPAPRPASMRVMGGATSASPAHAQRTWRRWRPPPTWACPGAGRSESMMPRCAWGAAAIQVRGQRESLGWRRGMD